MIKSDPVTMEETEHHIGDKIIYAEDQYEALKGADALVMITEWNEFRVPKWKEIVKFMNSKVVFDGRNIYEPKDMKKWGWTYYAIGKPNSINNFIYSADIKYRSLFYR